MKRIVRPSSLYSLFIIYERKRYEDLFNILDAFKFFFICKTWESNIWLYHDALRTPVLFKLLLKSAKKIMICVSKFVSLMWDHFIIDSRKMEIDTTQHSLIIWRNKEYPENHHPFFFVEIVSFISFLHLSYQKRNRHGCWRFLQSIENLILDSLTYNCYTKCSDRT